MPPAPPQAGSSPAPLLLPAQVEVLRLVAEGKDSREAARILDIPPAKAWLHLFCGRKRLGVATNDELIAAARRAGLI